LESSVLPIETFPALEQVGDGAAQPCVHGFVRRIPGIELSHDKATVLENLDHVHGEARDALGLGDRKFVTARQVHGNKVAVVNAVLAGDKCFENCDGLITNQRDVCLGIYVADCCAVYLLDQNGRAIGLVHSGKKGTALGVVRNAITSMREEFGIEPGDLVAQLSPCIRPPHYEIDFPAEIVRQCRAAGIKQVHDSGVCTACDLQHYYSYRVEKGKTGRMLALLAL
jgi:purine-nucleoside/S-methyl-5'-thioadenosine phosphorylase / adenosine deaminase